MLSASFEDDGLKNLEKHSTKYVEMGDEYVMPLSHFVAKK